MCPDADNPASEFTSIGKNVTSATTAAFDGQSKRTTSHDRRHADQRQRRKEIAERQQATPEESKPLRNDSNQQACPASDHISRSARRERRSGRNLRRGPAMTP